MTDKKTIGLTAGGEKSMEKLMAQGCFKDMMDAAKFAMSVAIRDGAVPAAVEGANTIWNVGSFDSDGQIRQIIPVLYPGCETPYRAAEALVDQGLARLLACLDDGTFDPVSQLQPSS
jgi:hypothetical protein